MLIEDPAVDDGSVSQTFSKVCYTIL